MAADVLAVFRFNSISIPASTTVRAVGSRPLVLLASGAVAIAGILESNGESATLGDNVANPGGAGGGTGVACPTTVGGGPGGGGSGTLRSGGGGGGFPGDGGAGQGSEGVAGQGGLAYGDLTAALQGAVAAAAARVAVPSPRPAAGEEGPEVFADVPASNGFCPFVEELFDRGVVNGCATGPLRYCPANPVTREQMGKFLTLTFSLQRYGI